MKATCPVCLRSITVGDGRRLREHNRRRTRRGVEPERCHGSGGQPADQTTIGDDAGAYDPGGAPIPY